MIVDFFFDYRSPYSYLAHCELARKRIPLAYHPFEILDLMKRVGNVPTSVLCKPKSLYLGQDLRRWASRYGVPFRRHPDQKGIDGPRLLRATLAADACGQIELAVATLFHAMWGEPKPLATLSDVVQVLKEAGIDPRVDGLLIDDRAFAEELDKATMAAVERGVFGAPTFFVDQDMYFGNDRLEFVFERLARAAA